MHDGFENYPLNQPFVSGGFMAFPESFTGPDGFEWGMNRLTGQTAAGEWARVIDLSGAPLGGANGVVNASRVLRIQTITAQQPNGFYGGAGVSWPHPLSADEAMSIRVGAEFYSEGAGNQYSMIVRSGAGGSSIFGVYWGGACSSADDPGYCSDNGLPEGPIDGVRLFGINLNFDGGNFRFFPSQYCEDARGNAIPGCTPPPGSESGDFVDAPIGQWVRYTYAAQVDGYRVLTYDRLDGLGEFAINGDSVLSPNAITNAFARRVEFNSSFGALGDRLFVDNIEASGLLYVAPAAPEAGCPLVDDLDWMDVGLASVQAGAWQFPNVLVRVEQDVVRGKIIQQPNDFFVSPGRFRRAMSRSLEPIQFATNDLVVAFDAASTPRAVRAFALFNGDDIVARVTLGLWPFETFENQYDPSVLVQINPEYEPIDPSFGFAEANAPVIGVDVADTGFDWINDDQFRRVEMRLSNNGSLRVSIDGQRVYAGPGGFTTGVDLLAFECENNAYGGGAALRLDALAVECNAPSCATDFDFDDTTTFADLNAVLSNFGASGLSGFNPGDANADGSVDFADLNAVLSAFGSSCQ